MVAIIHKRCSVPVPHEGLGEVFPSGPLLLFELVPVPHEGLGDRPAASRNRGSARSRSP